MRRSDIPKTTPLASGSDPNPSGLCKCGCGGETSTVRWSDKTKGLVRGHHREWINGHARAIRGCRVKSCDGRHEAQGYCAKHYQRLRKYGPKWVDELPSPAEPQPCRVDGCERTTKAKSGLCPLHYQRLRTNGTLERPPHWSKDPKRRDEIIARIAEGNRGKARTPEQRLAVSRAQKGRKQTPESIAKRVANMPKTRNFGPPTARQIAAARKAREAIRTRKGPTRLELATRWLLESLGVEFCEQEEVGVYTVDFFVPKIGLVVEADGSYWHQNEARERARDAYLLRDPRVRSVVHLTEDQLKPWTPKRRVFEKYRTAIAA